jgi:biotin carboxylase
MSGPAGADRSPRRLAFIYHPFSFGALDLAEAADGVCELIWIVDSTMADVELMSKLLVRLGRVVDVAGLDAAGAAELIAPHRPDGLLCLADSLMVRAAEIAQALALPFHSPALAAMLSDKYLQPRAFTASGVAAAQAWLVPRPGDEAGWATLVAEDPFPSLLKPRHGEGGRDIVAVASLAQLQARLDELGHEEERVLERYIEDRPQDRGSHDFAGYVSVESFVSAGVVSDVAIMGRTPLVEPFRESGFFIPAALEKPERRTVLALARRAIAALGIQMGTLHTEIKLTPDGPHLIEINGRLGGGSSPMLAAVADVNLLETALRLALGEDIVIAEMPTPSAVVFVLYRHAPLGMRRVRAIEGLEELRAQEGVERVIVNRGAGRDIDWREGSWGHVFSVHGVVESHERLAELARYVREGPLVIGE